MYAESLGGAIRLRSTCFVVYWRADATVFLALQDTSVFIYGVRRWPTGAAVASHQLGNPREEVFVHYNILCKVSGPRKEAGRSCCALRWQHPTTVATSNPKPEK